MSRPADPRKVFVNVWLIAVLLLSAWAWLGWQHRQRLNQDAALSPTAQLGQKVFHDTSLSASGQQSCATCHLKEQGHASARGREFGGPDGQTLGPRNTPSLRYLWQNTGLHFDDDGKAVGGFFWDGRADSLAAQAAEPFLNSAEMANPDKASVVVKLSRSRYAQDVETLYGKAIWQDPEKVFAAMTQALASYQIEDPDFHRFDSVFDKVMQGKARFNAAQERGWALFKDPEKGNCAACHTAEPGPNGRPPLFTDHSYDNLGVPATAGPMDQGLCHHPMVRTKTKAQRLCGAFKVPSLRNVAVRHAFFHNAAFTDLRDTLSFYATRDTDPKRWYGSNTPLGGVPKALRANVNRTEVPYGQRRGEKPRLSEQDIDDLLAFLETLTDADLGPLSASLAGSTAAANAAVRVGPLAANPTLAAHRETMPRTTH